MPAPTLLHIINELVKERDRQDEMWGQQDHPNRHGNTGPHFSFAELLEDSRALNEQNVAKGENNWTDILLEEVFEALSEPNQSNLRTELIQVAAVAVAWVEAIDRRTLTAVDKWNEDLDKANRTGKGMPVAGSPYPTVEEAAGKHFRF